MRPVFTSTCSTPLACLRMSSVSGCRPWATRAVGRKNVASKARSAIFIGGRLAVSEIMPPMNLREYAAHDALGLAALVAKKEVSPTELAKTALEAINAVNGEINAVVETYPDRIESLDEGALGKGPFRGVPFLIKDVFGHEAGRKIEF